VAAVVTAVLLLSAGDGVSTGTCGRAAAPVLLLMLKSGAVHFELPSAAVPDVFHTYCWIVTVLVFTLPSFFRIASRMPISSFLPHLRVVFCHCH
jgi:hypothetical protein